MVYDHHCPWIINCVGARNYCFFYMFIILMELDMLYTLCYEIYGLADVIKWSSLGVWQILHVITASYTLLTCIFCVPLM